MSMFKNKMYSWDNFHQTNHNWLSLKYARLRSVFQYTYAALDKATSQPRRKWQRAKGQSWRKLSRNAAEAKCHFHPKSFWLHNNEFASTLPAALPPRRKTQEQVADDFSRCKLDLKCAPRSLHLILLMLTPAARRRWHSSNVDFWESYERQRPLNLPYLLKKLITTTNASHLHTVI